MKRAGGDATAKRWRITMRCYGCGRRAAYVVPLGMQLMGLGKPCPSCGGVRTAESVAVAPPLVLIDGNVR